MLYSNHSALEELWRPKPQVASTVATVSRFIDAAGIARATGTADLKSTQAYPVEFGRAVGTTYANILAREKPMDGVTISDLDDESVDMHDVWADAELETVLADLRKIG